MMLRIIFSLLIFFSLTNYSYSASTSSDGSSKSNYAKAANLIKRYGSVAFSYILKNDSETFFTNFKFECVLEWFS